jgi:YfiH family protein
MRSPLLETIPGIVHGFGERAEPLPQAFASTWEERRPRWRQVHGVRAVRVDATAQDCGETDALYGAVTGVPIAVMTADCVPVLLARKDGAKVAAVHAGWRGTRARILGALWDMLRAEGEKPADWVAAVGPAIGPCCYEVSEELAADFAREFPAGAVPAHRRVDLPAINAGELGRLGLGGVDLLRACTRCATTADGAPRFFSYRREGGGTRQWSVVARIPLY